MRIILGMIGGIIAMGLSSIGLGKTESVFSILYYAGPAQVLNLMSGVSSSQDVIMVRTVDSDSSLISEIACAKSSGAAAIVSPVYMKVSGTTLKMADTEDVDHPNQLMGTGTVSGQAWNWNYLTFSMTWTNGVKVEDANFLVGNVIAGRKQLFLPNGQPLELYDINMTTIDQTTYEKAFWSMKCGSTR